MAKLAAFALALLCLGSFGFALGQGPPPEDDLDRWAGVKVTDITLAGNHITKDWVIAREIWTDVGDSFDPATARGDATRLENLAIFGSVEITPTDHLGGVALNYEFTEMPWIIPFPALSYSEENGFSVGLGVSSPNFAGRDVTLSGSALFGGQTTYKFKAENPWITGNHVSLGLEAWHQTRQNILLDFEQVSDRATVTGGKYIGDNGRLKVYGGYYGVGSNKPNITLDPDNYDDLWHLGSSVGLDSRNSWRMPHQGWHNEVSLLYLGGDANSLSFDFDVVRYQPLGEKTTLAFGPLLSLQTGQVDQQIPQYMQYFLGGANSIRGYKLEELGPNLYGQNQMLFNVEMRYLIYPVTAIKVFKWSVGVGLEAAAFGDIGVAWSRPGDFNSQRARNGYGAGVRVLLPGVESIRFDWAYGESGEMVFNFGVNSLFFARKLRIR